jgi:hypothetical protein
MIKSALICGRISENQRAFPLAAEVFFISNKQWSICEIKNTKFA